MEVLGGVVEVDDLDPLGQRFVQKRPVVFGAISDLDHGEIGALAQGHAELLREDRLERRLTALGHPADLNGAQALSLGIVERNRPTSDLLKACRPARRSVSLALVYAPAWSPPRHRASARECHPARPLRPPVPQARWPGHEAATRSPAVALPIVRSAASAVDPSCSCRVACAPASRRAGHSPAACRHVRLGAAQHAPVRHPFDLHHRHVDVLPLEFLGEELPFDLGHPSVKLSFELTEVVDWRTTPALLDEQLLEECLRFRGNLSPVSVRHVVGRQPDSHTHNNSGQP
ncbi:uncharacterized protein CMC5_028550 [Chondromyces crocatus]|uniref:Uncharacterized protein n=1 Tax=Chondromyces crocatus TaxID=52 RepID=A0A0K1ECY9_CHOCO|nr:uncharacterized protein CMC5_028550 [Chondromyces crocatus]